METFNFSERLQVIQSEDLRAAQAKSLQDRLRRAHTEIKALTPEPGRGRHQYRDEESFKAALAAVIEKHKVAGLLEVEWEVEEQKETRLVGRGRAGVDRPRREIVKRRCVVKSVKRDRKAIFEAGRRLGWRVQLSNAPEEVSLQTCVNHYRANWRGERNYNRLKGEPVGIDPIFVRNDDQIIGLTNLLTVAVRLECLIEVQVARGLQSESKEIKGLYPGLPNKGTDHPTAVAMLKAISRKEITLTRAEFNGQTSLHLSPLPDWLPAVLRYLHLSSTLYADLQNKSAFDISIFGK
jgi:transposase